MDDINMLVLKELATVGLKAIVMYLNISKAKLRNLKFFVVLTHTMNFSCINCKDL